MSPARQALDPEALRRRTLRRRRFGQRLRETRERAGLTQEGLANVSGLSRTMIVEVEAGRRGVMLDRLWDLARALGSDPTDLVRDVG